MILSYDTLPDTIWGEMYGLNRTNPHAIIINIKKSKLRKTKNDDGVYYIWGWPGPDVNLYKFSDYGETWAFTPEELAPAKTFEETYSSVSIPEFYDESWI